MYFRSPKGFTLIELLVVISIISLLSSIVIVSLRGARDKANLAAGLKFATSNHRALGAYSEIDVSFSEGSGSTVYDGNANTTVSGTVSGSSWSTDTPTNTGYSFNFNGTNNYIQGSIDGSVFANSSGVEQDFTISAWFKHTAGSQWAGIFSNAVGVNDTAIMTMRNNTNEFGMMRPGVAETGVYVDLGADHYNKWIYGVITYKKSTNRLTVYAFMDGKMLQNSTTLSWNLQTSNSYYIGRHHQGGTFLFNGKISEVHVYGDTLSFAELQNTYLAERDRYNDFLIN